MVVSNNTANDCEGFYATFLLCYDYSILLVCVSVFQDFLKRLLRVNH